MRFRLKPKVFKVARPEVDPAGIAGSLLIASGDLSDDAIDRFHQLASGEHAKLAILQFDRDETSQQSTKRLQDRLKKEKFAELKVVDLTNQNDKTASKELLNSATGVWLVANDEKKFDTTFDSGLQKGLVAVRQRGGIVATSSSIAKRFAQVIDSTADSKDSSDGLSWLPESLIDIAPLAADKNTTIAARLQNHPNLLGYEIESKTALVVQQRRLSHVGTGKVRIHFPSSGPYPAKQVELSSDNKIADLTALRIAAARRLEPLYPAIKPPAPKVDNGTLIIIGGGGMPKDIVSKFVQLAGGEKAKILVLPTAMPDPIPSTSGIADTFRKAGAKDVQVLTGRTLDVVESDEYLKAFREATGIWFGGGRQWRFADAYLGTKAHQLMLDMLNRGGVIMGSSAGASIQGGYLARANPLGNLDIMAAGYERGLNFLPGAAIDQHFAQRGRFKDMTSLVNRYPQLLGIGIDESTALVVTGQTGKVDGKGQVHFYDRRKPVVKEKPDYQSVANTGSYDLVDRKVLDPGITAEEERALEAQRLKKITDYGDWLIQKHDTNNDGKLSKDEYAKMRYQPKDADKNGDGFLSIDEIVAWLQTL